MGHISKDCKAPKKIHLNSDLECFGGGKIGHLRINCPVKKVSQVGAIEEQEEGNDIIGTCGAGSVFTPKMDLEPQHSSINECIREDHLLLANGRSSVIAARLNAYQKNTTMNKMPITKRFVGPHQITVLRDTGCSSVVIKKQFMEPNQYTGTYGFMLMANRMVRKVPHARIEINTPYDVGNVEAVCLTDT